ncbi:MAG: glycosylase [Planctomycetota bacterium]
MLRRRATHRLLSPDDLKPSRDGMRVIGVFNPAAARRADGRIVMLARVAEAPTDRRSGFHALPRIDADGGLVVEYLPEDQDTLIDPRKVVRAADGLMRLKFVSHIRAFLLDETGTRVESELPPLLAEGPYETFGVEDPRITVIDGTYFVTYVSVSEHGAATSLATTRDFETYERHGIIFCPENKDVVLLPEKVGGRFVALHRPNTFQRFCKPEMWLATSDDAVAWGGHRHVWSGRRAWDDDRIGAGPPPVRVAGRSGRPGGLLELYHGSRRATKRGEVGAYQAGLLLLDPDDPARVLAHSPEPVMAAQHDWEMTGFVPNVVFPTGVIETDNQWQVYYGAADTHVGVAVFDLDDLMGALQP